MEKKVVSDKNKLFAAVNTECHHLKVSPDSEEHLKVWVKEPTWLQVETALSSVLNIDSKTQNFDLDLNKKKLFSQKSINVFYSFSLLFLLLSISKSYV